MLKTMKKSQYNKPECSLSTYKIYEKLKKPKQTKLKKTKQKTPIFTTFRNRDAYLHVYICVPVFSETVFRIFQ